MFVKQILERGGSIHPLLIDSKLTNGTGLTNPSVLADEGRVLVNLRHVEYSLYHSEKYIYCHPWGPLQYLHPENDMHLRTNNYVGILNEDLSIKYYSKIDTSVLDKPPLWDFVGLEDVRLVRWNGKLYASGVRRDTTTNGQGRMELSEIIEVDGTFKEVSRFRIPAPDGDGSYCEKNWMPVIDMPFHYVKWCNPTQVVKVDIEKGTCETVFLGTYVPYGVDFRGGSQVFTYKDYRICLSHQTDLTRSKTGRKDGEYLHRFIVWDKDWNIVKYGEPFSFLKGKIEFCCGGTLWKNNLLVTFGFQDNSSFLLRIPESYLDDIVKPVQKTVVDCFSYFNPVNKEILELRVNMLKDVVDKFIICESNRTHSGKNNEYGLKQTIKDLNLPEDKIIVIEQDIPDNIETFVEEIDYINCYEGNDQNIESVKARARERIQRDALQSVIEQFNDETVFIVSDCDEIIKPGAVNFLSDMVRSHTQALVKIPLIHLEGKANLRVYEKDSGTPKRWDRSMFMCTKQHLRNATPTQLRSGAKSPYPVTYITQDGNVIEDLGWHFSWMGNSEKRKIKRESFIHYQDKLSYLGDTTYNDEQVYRTVEEENLQDGSMAPSGDKNSILHTIDNNQLPADLFTLERVKNVLL